MNKVQHWVVSFVKKVGTRTLDKIMLVCFALNTIGFGFLCYSLLFGEVHTLSGNHLWGFATLAIAVASLIGLLTRIHVFHKHKWPRVLVTLSAGLFFMLGGLTMVGEVSGVAVSIWLYTGALNLLMVPIFVYMPADFKTMLELNQQVEDSMAELDELKDKNHD